MTIEGKKTSIGRYAYDERFYRYIQQGATRSASVIAPLIAQRLGIQSIVDVGCGAGAWLAEYSRAGIPLCTGVDGDYVKQDSLLIPPANFKPLDISLPFELGRRFDLVQCLEVGEHIKFSASRTLIANLVKHGDFVLFSAAIPGQGGENHINEQSYEFWRAIFAAHDYAAYDFLRPLLRREKTVEIWYRQNVILYVANHAQRLLPEEIACTKVPANGSIADVSGVSYKMRTRILSRLPSAWVSRLAVLKHRCVLLGRTIVRRDSPDI